jgi:phospholipase C
MNGQKSVGESKIQHLIVLMLENRSFDHLLGYMEYPADVPFEGLHGRENSWPNPLPDGGSALPGKEAPYEIGAGPGHSHQAVLAQLLGSNAGERPYRITCAGYAADYETNNPGQGVLALQCFTPERLPVLASLAKAYAVCEHWFCSVPGATWPNRNFAHAATSAGEVDIHLKAYKDRTILVDLLRRFPSAEPGLHPLVVAAESALAAALQTNPEPLPGDPY